MLPVTRNEKVETNFSSVMNSLVLVQMDGAAAPAVSADKEHMMLVKANPLAMTKPHRTFIREAL